MTRMPLDCQHRMNIAAAMLICLTLGQRSIANDRDTLFEIRVLDQATQRGIPMVSLTTVDDVTYITDSGGRVALHEPELWGQTVYFKVESPGYQHHKDGFGFAGVALRPAAGRAATILLERVQPAERLYRVTGRDIYLETVRLGITPPTSQPLIAGGVLGQDSIQSAIYAGKLFWFWGDTNRLQYPLGHFRTSGATSRLPQDGGLAPADGIDLSYFTSETGFSRPMVEVSDPNGVVWIHGVSVVSEISSPEKSRERMIAQYSRRKGLEDSLEQGLVVWNDERELFEVARSVDLRETWRMVSDHPVSVDAAGRAAAAEPAFSASDGAEEWLMFGNPFPNTRVRRTIEAAMEPSAYESFSCREELADEFPTSDQLAAAKPLRDSTGKLIWGWKKGPPVNQKDEIRWLKSGLLQLEEARFLPRDADHPERIIEMHSGTVHWNPWRQRWIMVAIEHAWHKNSPSFLGEVFYSEADSAQGPFVKALKVASHPGQSFYNPCHHAFFDSDNGRTICFEGTFCNTFTTSPAVPRYNYNQLMYQLDLSSQQIEAVFGPPADAAEHRKELVQPLPQSQPQQSQ